MTDFRLIFLYGLAELSNSRLDLWEKFRKDSEYSKEAFWQKLNDCWSHYKMVIETKLIELNALGNYVTDFKLPLLIETNSKIPGHLGKNELSDLRTSLIELAIKWNIILYYYQYDLSGIQTSTDGTPSKQYELVRHFSDLSFQNELITKKPEEIKGFLNFHLKHFRREGGEESKWIEYTKSKMPDSLSELQKDAFFSWFESKDINGEIEKICKVPFIGNLISNNFNLSESIISAFYDLVPQKKDPNSKREFQWENSPYQVSIYGAYPLMSQWLLLMYRMDHCNEESGIHKDFQKEKVFESLKDFARGFQYGFDNFLNDKVNTSSALSSTEQFKVQKIMDFLSSPSNRGGFSETVGMDQDIFSDWYNDGIDMGYNYRAWYLIFENHKLFESYFESKKNSSRKDHISILKTASSFTLQKKTNKRKLTYLWNTLREIGAIECSLAEFRKLFSGETVIQRVRWKSSPFLLQRLIHYLHNEKFNNSAIVLKTGDHWGVTLNCFEGETRARQFKKETLAKAKPVGDDQTKANRIKAALKNLE